MKIISLFDLFILVLIKIFNIMKNIEKKIKKKVI